MTLVILVLYGQVDSLIIIFIGELFTCSLYQTNTKLSFTLIILFLYQTFTSDM